MTLDDAITTLPEERFHKNNPFVSDFLRDVEGNPVIIIRRESESQSDHINFAWLVASLSSWTLPPSEVKSKNIELGSNSTEPTKTSEEITAQLIELFERGKKETFEDGMETQFSRNLLSLIEKHGSSTMDIVIDLILSGSVNAEVAAETMRWLGLMESQVSRKERRWLLERCLRDSSERIRDGALLGLSFMDDPLAISSLEKAIQAEQIPELREDMRQVLGQLKDTQESSR